MRQSNQRPPRQRGNAAINAQPAAGAAGRPPKRLAPPPPEEDSDDVPEQAPLQQAKRARPMIAEHGGSSGSDSGSESSDSQSDTSCSDVEDGDQGPDEGVPLGQLVALRQDGSTSAAAMRARAQALRQQGKASFQRQGKHRPVEMSSRKPVPVFREVLQGGKREVSDPRFESLAGGRYQEEAFKLRYAFLYNEALPAERDDIRAALGRARGEAARAALQARLARVEAQLRSEEARRKREAFKRDVKAKERAAVREGKRPFFLKKNEQRRLELVARYEELKASGKLEAYMAKRRKRNAAKDHRHLPAGRRDAPPTQ